MKRGGAWSISAHALVGAGALLFAMAALVTYSAHYHAFWRDEVHQELLAANIPMHRFVMARRVEGIPFLFNLILKLFTLVFLPSRSLLLGGAVGYGTLLFGTYRCILSICRRTTASLVMTALFAGTYVYAYEYGVMVREYGLGAGLGLATNAYLREALRGRSLRPVLFGTASAALCASTCAHAATLAGGALAAFGMVALVRDRGIRRIWPTVFALPFFGFALYLALPFPGRHPDLNVDHHQPRELFQRLALQAISGSFTGRDWWYAASFGDPRIIELIATLRHWGVLGIALGVAYSIVLRLTPDWSDYRAILVYDVLAIVIGWAPLVEIIVNHYWGFPRHHGFFAIPVLAVLAGWGLQRGGGALQWGGAAAVALLGPWLVYQYVVCGRVLDMEMRVPFSDTKAEAALIPPGAHVVADSLTMEEGIMFWQPTVVMRGGDNAGRHLGAMAVDETWYTRVPLAPLVREECIAAPDATYYSGEGWFDIDPRCLTLVRAATPHTEQLIANESFNLWRVNCACATTGRRL
jgi:hypothetical protein